jgi:hypothetical protein
MKLRELISEGLDEIDHADALDSGATSPNDLMQSGKVIGDIEGNDIVMISKGNQTVYILKVDDRATAFIGFEGKNLKNIKNFTETPGVIRALIGYLVHKKNMKIVVSPNEPLTLDGLKWVTKLITDPRGLVIKDHAGQDIDPIQLKQEWQTAKKTGTPGTTGITISENIQFGNKIRQSELKRNTDSLLMPFNFYSVKTKKQGVAEDWSTKYKRSIDCNNPKGFSQRAHCQGRKKHEDIDLNEVESADKKEAVRRIQKMLNKKFNANLDIDGILGPLTLRSINKFMPDAQIGFADEPNKTTAVQGKKIKKKDIEEK